MNIEKFINEILMYYSSNNSIDVINVLDIEKVLKDSKYKIIIVVLNEREKNILRKQYENKNIKIMSVEDVINYRLRGLNIPLILSSSVITFILKITSRLFNANSNIKSIVDVNYEN